MKFWVACCGKSQSANGVSRPELAATTDFAPSLELRLSRSASPQVLPHRHRVAALARCRPKEREGREEEMQFCFVVGAAAVWPGGQQLGSPLRALRAQQAHGRGTKLECSCARPERALCKHCHFVWAMCRAVAHKKSPPPRNLLELLCARWSQARVHGRVPGACCAPDRARPCRCRPHKLCTLIASRQANLCPHRINMSHF